MLSKVDAGNIIVVYRLLLGRREVHLLQLSTAALHLPPPSVVLADLPRRFVTWPCLRLYVHITCRSHPATYMFAHVLFSWRAE